MKDILIMKLPSTVIKQYSYKYFIIPLLLLVTSCGKVSEDVNTSNLLIPTSGDYSWSETKMIGSLKKLKNAENWSDVEQFGGTKTLYTKLSIKPNANGDFQYELTSGSQVDMSTRKKIDVPITGMMTSQIIIEDDDDGLRKTLKWFFEDNEHWGGQPPYLELEECMFKPTYDDLLELIGQSIETSEGWTYTYALNRDDLPKGEECTCNCSYLDSTDIEPKRYRRNAYHIELVYAEGGSKELTYYPPKPVIEYEESQVEANEKVVEEEMGELSAETEVADEPAAATDEVEQFTSYYVDDPDGWVNLRNRPDGDIIKRVDNYEVGVKVGKEGDWILLRFDDGLEGFIHNTRLKEAP